MQNETPLKPPYTNKWGCTPGPDYRQCAATTKSGVRCRRGARRGHDTCDQHADQKDARK